MPVQSRLYRKPEYQNGSTGLDYWSLITAYGLAASEDIKLSPLHFDILDWLRHDYFQHGTTPLIRLIFRIETAFADQGGVLLLLSLFPKGPQQALKIAGLPVQRSAANSSVSMH
jgi:tRNA 2-thiouridine synthesizing protein E